MAGAAPETVKQCQLCDLKTTSMSFLLRHLTLVHSTKPGFFFSCSLNGCQRTFHNITTYKHHVYASHSKHHTNLDSASVTPAPIELVEDPDDISPDDPEEHNGDDSGFRDAEDRQRGA